MKKDNIVFCLAGIVTVGAISAWKIATAPMPKAIKYEPPIATPTEIAVEMPTPTVKVKLVIIEDEPTLIPTATPIPTLEPTEVPVPRAKIDGQTEFKTYERYTAITRKSSDQYKLQQIAVTGDYGIRMVDGRYCVALGSRWSVTIGEKLDVYMEDGTVIPVILGDCKQDRHTDPTNSWGTDNGDVLEFIVDENEIPKEVKISGSLNCIFPGKVMNIIKAKED